MADSNAQVSNVDIFTNPSGNQLLGVAIALIPLSVITVALRFWARHSQRKPLMLDDWFILPVLAGNIALASVMFWNYNLHAAGFVTPQAPANVNPLDYENIKIKAGKLLTWSIEIIQTWTLTFTKLSFVLLYRRLFGTGLEKGTFHWVSVSLIAVIVLWGIVFFLAFLTECGTHLSAWWTDIRELNEYCKASLPLEIAFAVTDITVDLLVFTLPLFMVSRLRMTRAKKIATAGMFCLGAFAIVAGLFRMAVMVEAIIIVTSDYTKKKSGANNGPVAAHAFWATIESAATLIAACLPVIYAPMRDLLRRMVGRPQRPRHETAYGYGGSGTRKSRHWQFDNLDDRGESGTVVGDEIAMVKRGASSTTNYIDSHASKATRTDSDDGSLDAGHIRVEHTIHQTSYATAL